MKHSFSQCGHFERDGMITESRRSATRSRTRGNFTPENILFTQERNRADARQQRQGRATLQRSATQSTRSVVRCTTSSCLKHSAPHVGFTWFALDVSWLFSTQGKSEGAHTDPTLSEITAVKTRHMFVSVSIVLTRESDRFSKKKTVQMIAHLRIYCRLFDPAM